MNSDKETVAGDERHLNKEQEEYYSIFLFFFFIFIYNLSFIFLYFL